MTLVSFGQAPRLNSGEPLHLESEGDRQIAEYGHVHDRRKRRVVSMCNESVPEVHQMAMKPLVEAGCLPQAMGLVLDTTAPSARLRKCLGVGRHSRAVQSTRQFGVVTCRQLEQLGHVLFGSAN